MNGRIYLEVHSHIAAHQIAIVVRTSIVSYREGKCWTFSGSKLPLAILIATDGVVQAYNLDGKPLALHAVEQFLPGAGRQLMEAAQETDPTL